MIRLLAAAMVTGLAGVAHAQDAGERRYVEDSHRAMATMMAGMDAPPTGDVDADFVATMVPHHQGAIDMARAELSHGHNELLRRIAQGIVVAQSSEIQAMRLALGTQPGRPANPVVAPEVSHHAP